MHCRGFFFKSKLGVTAVPYLFTEKNIGSVTVIFITPGKHKVTDLASLEPEVRSGVKQDLAQRLQEVGII